MAARPAIALLVFAALIGSFCVVVVRPKQTHPAASNPRPNPATVELAELPGAADASAGELKPLELLRDGNVCDNSEELYGGLCYRKCSLLTSGVAPIRTSSWTCCKSHPCTLSNQLGSIGTTLLCSGYDVGGDGSCPHKPGACLVDEELHLGVCYKKCSLLTDNHFPSRVGPATCCKTGGLGCLNLHNDKTNKAFDVGGGHGDHDPSTPADAHLPQKSLTETGMSNGLTTTVAPGSLHLAASSGHLKPVEHMHDGNICADNEELYGGLCYGKCAVLTSGEAPIRTSSWTCCESHPCGLWNSRGSVGTTLLCNGYDVSGDGSCPHKPGACLENEELHLGICYEKCSLLTNGAFPHRFAAATCCKVNGLGCFNPRNMMTSSAFDKGGGEGDHVAATPSAAHGPMESLTEQTRQHPSKSQGSNADHAIRTPTAQQQPSGADQEAAALEGWRFLPASAAPAVVQRGLLKGRRL